MDLKKERMNAFQLGYLQAIVDYSDFQKNLPARHGGKILFQRDAYAEECNQFMNDAKKRAELRAEQKIAELMEFEEQERERREK